MSRLSQETIAIVTVGLSLAALILALIGFVISSTNDLRAEARADRAESRAAREAIRTESRAAREAIRAEARADREAFEKQITRYREAFEKHITRLTQEQSRLTGIVEQMRTAER